MSTLFDALRGLLRTLLKLVLLAVGALLGLMALALGLLLTAGLVSWALLRGRRPGTVKTFRWRGMPQPGATRWTEVVDVEAHEVRDPVPPVRVISDR